MHDYDYLTIARIVHVLGVVLWIGGVGFVTTVLIPALRARSDPRGHLEWFEHLEDRFAFQARVTTVFTGVSGFFMIAILDAWDRYFEPRFWWMHLMTLIWLVFTIVLFYLEPRILHRWFHERALADPEGTFALLHTLHKILLGLSLLAVAAAIAGVHGLSYL